MSKFADIEDSGYRRNAGKGPYDTGLKQETKTDRRYPGLWVGCAADLAYPCSAWMVAA